MTDADANKILNRITALADEAFTHHGMALAARERARKSRNRFAALGDAGMAAKYAMRVELADLAATDVAMDLPLDCEWRPVAKVVRDRVREHARSASLAAIEALELVRAKPLRTGTEDAMGGAL